MSYPLIQGAMITVALIAADILPPKEETAAGKEFNSRVAEYLKLRNRAAKDIPALKPKAEPEQIQAHRLALAQAISTARAGAPQGAVFTPEVREYILGIVRSEMRGKQGAPARAATKQGNPTAETPAVPVPLRVNAPYPDKAPLSMTPPTLLIRLPTLPKELDFRFVGRSLILRDVGASLIVDYIESAIP